MPKRRRVSREQRQQTRENVIKHAAINIQSPVSFYERWHDEELFVFTDEQSQTLHPFCALIWQEEGTREKCRQDHRERISAHKGVGISTCWLGVDSVCCALENDFSNVTLLGGCFRVRENHEIAWGRLQDFLAQQLPTRRQHLEDVWLQIPQISQKEAEITKALSLNNAGEIYLQRLKELDHFRSVVDTTTHDLAAIMQALIAEIETLQIELKERFNIGKKWEQRFEALISLCEQHGEYLDRHLAPQSKDSLPQYQPHSISKLIHDCVGIYESVAKTRGVDIRIDLEQQVNEMGEHQVLNICMDRMALRQALQNVIDNAVKYSFSSSGQKNRWIDVTGRLTTIFGRSGYQIRVQNLGLGIESDELEQVFEPGYQGRRRLDEGRRGHGLGLDFVKTCIDEHEGTVSIDSHQQKRTGWLTTLTIWLPFDNKHCQGDS